MITPTIAYRLATACVFLLLALHVSWNAFGWWPGGHLAVLVLLGLPLAVVATMQVAYLASARFWAGVVALFTFCHGVTEAWTLAAARGPALAEVLLSVGAVLASSWDGMVARFGKRRQPPTV